MRNVIFWLFIIGLLAVCGCSNTTKIEDIKADPEYFLNKECVVSGFVTEVLNVPALNNDAFKIDGFTGVNWVYTTKGVCRKGTYIPGKHAEGI
jgi:hypothetical protein